MSKSTEYSKKQVKLSTGNRRLVFPASVPYGYETAVFIENPKHKKGQLLKLHLKFKDSSRDIYETHQTYYRLAFYSVDDLGFPGELLYFENIIIKPEKDIKNYKIDLEDKAIPFTKTGLFVGIETIKPDHIALIGSMYLTTPSILHTHTTKNLEYRRFRSNDWSKQSRKSVFKKKLYTAPFIKIKVVYEK